MHLSGPTVSLVPFDPTLGHMVYNWQMDPDYAQIFRGHIRAFSPAEAQQYPAMIGGEVLFIQDKETREIMGMLEAVPDSKRNQAFLLGILVDKKHQHKPLVTEALVILFNYMFNYRGFRKAKMDILAGNQKLRSALEGQGFTCEGRRLDEVYFDGEFHDELSYGMFRDFFNSKYREHMESYGWNR